MIEAFQYFIFIENISDLIISGRPVNSHRKTVIACGEVCINPIWRDFEDFANEMRFEAFNDEIKPGCYDRNDIEIITGGSGRRYYALKELIPN